MTVEALKQEAAKVLEKAFRGDSIPVHVVQAAVAILTLETPKA